MSSTAEARGISFAEAALGIAIVIAWIAGVVLAAGWWKLLAVVFPFYAWYLVVEQAMQGVCR